MGHSTWDSDASCGDATHKNLTDNDKLKHVITTEILFIYFCFWGKVRFSWEGFFERWGDEEKQQPKLLFQQGSPPQGHSGRST